MFSALFNPFPTAWQVALISSLHKILQDMLQGVQDPEEDPLLNALLDFGMLVLHGDTPEEVRSFFFNASLVSLREKIGGVRPIAIGCTLRGLVSKVACGLVINETTTLLSLRQLGYWVRGGAEAAAMPPEFS